MALVFTKEKLRRRFWPLVVQSFIHHEAVLYKIFILGAKWFVTIRPSLKNFVQGGTFFNGTAASSEVLTCRNKTARARR